MSRVFRNFFGGAFFGGEFFNSGSTLQGGGSQGAFRNVRSARRAQRERVRREEEEIAMILQAVMPLIEAGASAQDIFLQPMSTVVDERRN